MAAKTSRWLFLPLALVLVIYIRDLLGQTNTGKVVEGINPPVGSYVDRGTRDSHVQYSMFQCLFVGANAPSLKQPRAMQCTRRDNNVCRLTQNWGVVELETGLPSLCIVS